MKPHIMIDVETLGIGNNACLLSLAGVKFDPNNPTYETLDEFHVAIDPDSCIRLGMTVTGATILWWMHPDRAAAREKLLSAERIDLASVLDGFSLWFGGRSLPTWGNGSTFDNVIVRNAYGLISRECPWTYKDDCCFRTFRKIVPTMEVPRDGVIHDALDDARAQAFLLKDIVAFLRMVL